MLFDEIEYVSEHIIWWKNHKWKCFDFLNVYGDCYCFLYKVIENLIFTMNDSEKPFACPSPGCNMVRIYFLKNSFGIKLQLIIVVIILIIIITITVFLIIVFVLCRVSPMKIDRE